MPISGLPRLSIEQLIFAASAGHAHYISFAAKRYFSPLAGLGKEDRHRDIYIEASQPSQIHFFDAWPNYFSRRATMILHAIHDGIYFDSRDDEFISLYYFHYLLRLPICHAAEDSFTGR